MAKVHKYKLDNYFGGYALCVNAFTVGYFDLSKDNKKVTCKRCLKIMEKK